MGWVSTVSSQMDWEWLPVAPLYADVQAYCSHVKMYCKWGCLLSSHPQVFIHFIHSTSQSRGSCKCKHFLIHIMGWVGTVSSQMD